MSRRKRHKRSFVEKPIVNAERTSDPSNFNKISFHQGKALRHLANMYPTLQAVILELVQNALDRDVEATKISILIDFKTARLFVADNGKGISVDRMKTVLTTIADPARSREQKKGGLGQFALGLFSPLGKCDHYTFTSCPAPHRYGFNEWVVRCKQVEEQRDDISIPMRYCQELTLSEAPGKGQTKVVWRTKLEMHKFDKDAYISRIEMDGLVSAIQNRFSAVMRKNKANISIKIIREDGAEESRPSVQAHQFRGQKLAEYKVDSPEAGKVVIQLYVAPKIKGSRCGNVVMGTFESDFRFPFHYFTRSATQLLNEDIVTALSSGVFEGEIVASKVKLHANREAFHKDDAYIGLCVVIEDWFNSYGRKHLEEINKSHQDQRYQELGLKSLKVLENLLKNIKFSNLLRVLKSFKHGLIGTGHKEPEKKDVVGEQDQLSLSLDGNPGKPKTHDPDAEPRDRDVPEAEKKEKIHPTVTGPRGQVRRIVKHSSFGLQLTYEDPDLLSSSDLWKLDDKNGILAFNVRHPLWAECEKKDTALMKFQEFVAIQALTLYAMPEAFRDRQREVLDELIPSFVYWLLNADKARRN